MTSLKMNLIFGATFGELVIPVVHKGLCIGIFI